MGMNWGALLQVVTLLSNAGHKDLCKSIYMEAMENSGVEEEELTKYMKTRGWVAKFGDIKPTFTARDI
eukprot:9180059-Pyramimonas_sp.AAC.1